MKRRKKNWIWPGLALGASAAAPPAAGPSAPPRLPWAPPPARWARQPRRRLPPPARRPRRASLTGRVEQRKNEEGEHRHAAGSRWREKEGKEEGEWKEEAER